MTGRGSGKRFRFGVTGHLLMWFCHLWEEWRTAGTQRDFEMAENEKKEEEESGNERIRWGNNCEREAGTPVSREALRGKIDMRGFFHCSCYILRRLYARHQRISGH